MEKGKSDFSRGSVSRNILSLAIPMTVAQLTVVLYNMVDRAFIGHIEDVGKDAFTGMGLVMPITYIITAFANLSGMGGAPLFSIARGKGDDRQAGRIMGNAFVYLVVLGVLQMVVVAIYCKKINFPKKRHAPIKVILKAAWESKWALIAPVIVLGGIASGIFTATEAGVVLCIYAIFVSIFAYKEISFKDLPKVFERACNSMGVPCWIICLAALFGQVVTRGNMAAILCGGLLDITTSQTGIVLLTIAILFVVGLFVDGTVAMMVFVPVLYPIGEMVGLDPVYYAMIIMITILVGTVTPPVGLQLYIAAGIAKTPVMKVYIWPFVAVMMALMIACVFIPDIITFLPDLLSTFLKG